MSLKLAYIAIETNKFAEWKDFSAVVGYQYELKGECAFLRMDKRARRVILVKGPREDYAFCGLETDSREKYDAVIAQLKSAGVGVTEGTPEGTELRAVEHYSSFVDPAGLVVEIAYGCQDAETDYSSDVLPEGFVTGKLGMGHIAFGVPNNRKSEEFYIDVLGAKLSDHINQKMAGGELEISFIHFNPRHHTFAFASANGINPIVAKKALAKTIVHFMCEYHDIRDVLQAQERVKAAGIPFALTLGEHTNDKDVSFYVVTPSGFHLEIGAGALEIDDSTWVPAQYDAISIWGHDYQLGGGPIMSAVQKWLLR